MNKRSDEILLISMIREENVSLMKNQWQVLFITRLLNNLKK
jgi:hypothetical protein